MGTTLFSFFKQAELLHTEGSGVKVQVSLPPPPGGELRITNPFTTRAFLEKKIGVSSKLRLTSEIYLVRYFPSGEGRHRKQSEEINKHEHYKIHQY